MVVLMTGHMVLAQQWMTSFDAAKRIALVQDKMLFMIWEEAAQIPYPVVMNNQRGQRVIFENMFDNPEINKVIWEYFVPVKVNESLYADMYDQLGDDRSQSYMYQFDDDNIKIMDANGYILNTSFSPEAYFDLSEFIRRYALNTSFLKTELDNYAEQRDFFSSFRLASKYMDYSILVNDKIREEVINLANIYLDEADGYLVTENSEEKNNFEVKSNMLRLSQYLILDRPGKVLRQLKKMDEEPMDESNQSLQAFLYYTAYKLKEDEKDAALWKSKVSLVNLKKAELITNIHL